MKFGSCKFVAEDARISCVGFVVINLCKTNLLYF